MADWTRCPQCNLAHSIRADGRCPRCGAATVALAVAAEPAAVAGWGPGTFPAAPPAAAPGYAPPYPPPPYPAAPAASVALGGVTDVTVGSLVSRTFRVWSQNLGKLVLLVLIQAGALVGSMAIAGVTAFFGLRGGPRDPAAAQEMGMAFLRFMGLAAVVVMPVMVICYGALNYGVVRWVGGQSAGVGEMLGRGCRCFLSSFFAFLLVTLCCLGGLLLLVVPGIMLGVATSLTAPAVVVERAGPVQAFRRSLALSAGRRWEILGALMVLMGINFALNCFSGVLQFIPGVGVVLSLGLQLFFGQIPYLMLAVAYHDLRLLKEGVDTSELVRVFE